MYKLHAVYDSLIIWGIFYTMIMLILMLMIIIIKVCNKTYLVAFDVQLRKNTNMRKSSGYVWKYRLGSCGNTDSKSVALLRASREIRVGLYFKKCFLGNYYREEANFQVSSNTGVSSNTFMYNYIFYNRFIYFCRPLICWIITELSIACT